MISCGGGTLAAFYGFKEYSTNDLDAFVRLYSDGYPTPLYNAICEVAKENGCESDWLNDAIAATDWGENELTVQDMIDHFSYSKPIYFPRDEKYPCRLEVTPIELPGIMVAKTIANRSKDLDAVKMMITKMGFRSFEDMQNFFKERYNTFFQTSKYQLFLKYAKKYFEQG